jgi:hypothetical protein
MILLTAALALAAPTSAGPCTARTAVRTTVTEIGENPGDYLDRCVTVSGPASSIALFSGVEGIYRSQRLASDGNPDPREARRHRLGLYSEDNEIRRMKPANLPWLTVTGTVDSCERKQKRAEAAAGRDSIIMMSGYCHYYGGAVIDAVGFSLDRAKTPRRLTGERARRRVGDLVSAPADWPHLAAMRRLGEEFRAALRSGDKEALARLHDLDSKPEGQNAPFLDDLVAGAVSPFAEIRRDPTLPMAIFVRRSDLDRARAGRPPEEPFGTICFGRSGDRPVAWPIAANDADNDPARPYACTSIAWRDWASRKIGLDTRVSRGGWLAEPIRSD